MSPFDSLFSLGFQMIERFIHAGRVKVLALTLVTCGLCGIGFIEFPDQAPIYFAISGIAICLCLYIQIPSQRSSSSLHNRVRMCILCLTELSWEPSTELPDCHHAFHSDCYLFFLHFGDNLGSKCPECFARSRSPSTCSQYCVPP